MASGARHIVVQVATCAAERRGDAATCGHAVLRPAAGWLADEPRYCGQVISGGRPVTIDTAPDVVQQIDQAGVRRGQQRPAVRRLVGLNVEGDVLHSQTKTGQHFAWNLAPITGCCNCSHDVQTTVVLFGILMMHAVSRRHNSRQH